jgi:hypothetical protein
VEEEARQGRRRQRQPRLRLRLQHLQRPQLRLHRQRRLHRQSRRLQVRINQVDLDRGNEIGDLKFEISDLKLSEI